MNITKKDISLPALSALLCLAFPAFWITAEEPTAKVSKENLVEPVFRISKQETATTTTQAALVTAAGSVVTAPMPMPAPMPAPMPHPLDGPLTMAELALDHCQSNIADYTAIIVKRERIDGELNDECYMAAKIRHERRNDGGQVVSPFSVYLKFLKPSGIKGREVIFVRGHNKGKLIAHEGGFKGKFTPSLHLDPNGTLAMMGQRYPITDIGIENLCSKLIERGSRDRASGPCEVRINDANINKRSAKRIELVHPNRRPGLDFHIARIFVDDEYRIPVRYEAYDWPVGGGNVSVDDLIEEYTYIHLKFNVGLTDLDFDPDNPSYSM